MRIKKYAAIDIGSNAIRLLISNVIDQNKGQTYFIKNALVRVPVRLGQDTFTNGKISNKNITRIVKTIKAFKILMEIHEVENYLVYATAALREAINRNKVLEKVFESTKINIEIIDGQKEAKIISNSNIFEFIDFKKTFLYVDIGGGSTEFSILKGGQPIHSVSFKIGTVRSLNNVVNQKKWGELEKWIKKYTLLHPEIYLLGSGGNINKLHKMANLNDDEPITFSALSTLYDKLSQVTYEDRIIKYRLKPDRSDVIIPAAELLLKTLKWSGAKVIYVPKIGLSDGMIRELYKRK